MTSQTQPDHAVVAPRTGRRHAAILTRFVLAFALGTTFAGGLVASSAQAQDTATPEATQVVTGGTLEFVSPPGDVTFQGVTLSGVNQTSTPAAPQTIQVQDARGIADGWKIDLQPTQFVHSVDPGKTLPLTALSIPSAPAASTCLPSSTCTVATNTVNYALPVDAAPAPATTIYQADNDTGRGQLQFGLGWELAIPASTAEGTYTSTWTYSLTTAP